MKFECSCGWQPNSIGEGHCSKHHTNYRVLSDYSGCFECSLEHYENNKPIWTDGQLQDLVELIRKS